MSEEHYEAFCDVAYFDMWCVRRIGERTFGQGFHVVNQDSALALKAELEALQAEVERLTFDGIHTCHDDCPRLPCVQRREIEALQADVAELESWKVAEDAHHHMLLAEIRHLMNELQAHKDALAQAAPKP
jgi:hypothetical protein